MRYEGENNLILFTWRVYFHFSVPLTFTRGRRWIFITHLFYPRDIERERERANVYTVNLGVARTRETDAWKTLATADVRSRENRTAAPDRCGSVAAEKIRNTRRAREVTRIYTWGIEERLPRYKTQKNTWYILIKLLSVISDVSVWCFPITNHRGNLS